MSNNSNDTIFIGKKPLMTYVTSTIVQLATKPKVTIKARGLTTSIAIDVSQIVLKKTCLLYTSPSPRDISGSRMPSSA